MEGHGGELLVSTLAGYGVGEIFTLSGGHIFSIYDGAVKARVQYTAGPSFFPNGGGERFIRLAFSFESPERCYEGARLIARAILDARA